MNPEDEPPSLDHGEAIAVATGANLPPEANRVLKREAASVENGQLYGTDIELGTYRQAR